MKKAVIAIILLVCLMAPQLSIAHCHGPHKPPAPIGDGEKG
jgi:hypothetical protein